jgi:hypothetical protein
MTRKREDRPYDAVQSLRGMPYRGRYGRLEHTRGPGRCAIAVHLRLSGFGGTPGHSQRPARSTAIAVSRPKRNTSTKTQHPRANTHHPPPNTHHPPRTTQQDGSAPAPLFACVRYRTPPPTGKRPERRRRLFRFAVRFVVSDGSSGPIRPSLNLSNHVRR